MSRKADGPLKGRLSDHRDPLCIHGFAQDTRTPVARSLRALREVLAETPPKGTDHFSRRLRWAIGNLWNDLCDQDSYQGQTAHPDRPTGAERAQLVASLQDAATHLYAWCERNGCAGTSEIPDKKAAPQGWPDETGKGWTPPWGILRMEPPAYWGTSN
ncbi:hypothetical protein [Ruegeria atlantica]|uniref:hypothetical protein n=1 Tax=Ruegeria atlantica TaxID=81569 RepID=UPI00147EF027|nr:hypothetical protein [Ruegeria atlantica]